MNDDCTLCGASLCRHGFCRDSDCVVSMDSNGWHCQDCAEAQHDRMIEDYYGASTPQTDREREDVEERQR